VPGKVDGKDVVQYTVVWDTLDSPITGYLPPSEPLATSQGTDRKSVRTEIQEHFKKLGSQLPPRAWGDNIGP
jgi:hypothetical protein